MSEPVKIEITDFTESESEPGQLGSWSGRARYSPQLAESFSKREMFDVTFVRDGRRFRGKAFVTELIHDGGVALIKGTGAPEPID